MRSLSQRVSLLPLLFLVFTALSGCVDEKIVYVERELFEDPPTAALDFLGYSDHDNKLTVCGNCHVEKQGEWEGTAHASAWAGLQNSGAAQTLCEGCHTVNELGNVITETAGYTATGDARYEDVQCESCHGPGLAHVTNPKTETVPLAPISVGVGLTAGCGECHSDTHHPFVEEWAASRHGDGANAPNYRTRSGCMECHGAKGAFAAWGLNTVYLEKDDANASIGITCAVCHDPHDATNPNQLRFPIDVASVDQNLCMKCHHKRAVPEAESPQRGPHSPQGPLLLGEIGTVGWIPPSFQYDVAAIRGTHGSTANPRLCAGCHVTARTVNDAATGAFLVNATGHLFKAIPCLDAQGIPTADDTCPKTAEARSFASCTASGCHGDATAAVTALTLAQTRIADLVAVLNAMLAQVPASEFNSTDNIYTTAEGAKFNSGLGAIVSSAVHNPFMTEALLTGSITQVELDYGIAPSPSLILENILGEVSALQR